MDKLEKALETAKPPQKYHPRDIVFNLYGKHKGIYIIHQRENGKFYFAENIDTQELRHLHEDNIINIDDYNNHKKNKTLNQLYLCTHQ